MTSRVAFLLRSLCPFLLLVAVVPARAQFGIVLSGAGPVNRSMAGASAVPLDPIGAIYWNPATMTGLRGTQMGFGAEVVMPRSELSARLPVPPPAPGFPPLVLAGGERSDAGPTPVPSMAFTTSSDGPWSFGFSAHTAGGFTSNYPASTMNPILLPPPRLGTPLSIGVLGAELQVLQLAPAAAVRLTDRLSVGFSPTVNLGHLTARPGFIFPPDDANGDGNLTYPAGTQTRYHWGFGFQFGAYFETESGLHLGASLKSPQWFETFRFNGSDELGRPRPLNFRFDFPLIASVGVGYTGLECWTFAVDFRFIDYRNTESFDATGFDARGALRGLGWDSVFAVAAGAQYQLSEAASLRLGYSYNTNPIDDALTAVNVASPVILQHVLYAGASYQLTECLSVSGFYAHGFENEIAGPILSPFGPVPGSSVRSQVSADTFAIGATLKF